MYSYKYNCTELIKYCISIIQFILLYWSCFRNFEAVFFWEVRGSFFQKWWHSHKNAAGAVNGATAPKLDDRRFDGRWRVGVSLNTKLTRDALEKILFFRRSILKWLDFQNLKTDKMFYLATTTFLIENIWWRASSKPRSLPVLGPQPSTCRDREASPRCGFHRQLPVAGAPSSLSHRTWRRSVSFGAWCNAG